MNRWINLALKVSKTGKHNCASYLMGCVIVNKRVLAIASNYSRGNKAINLNGHAEVRAINKCKCCKGATLIIVRVNNRMSKPCSNCLKAIKEAGIKEIVYVNWESKIVTETI